MTWIQTFSGGRFSPAKPDFTTIRINDIAHALSNICRFGGHTQAFYSVAQHCVLVSEHVRNTVHDGCPIRLLALLHDAAEAYIGDIPRPLKGQIFDVESIERDVMEAVVRRFNLSEDSFALNMIRNADLMALATERRDLMTPTDDVWECLKDISPWEEVITPWNPEVAEERFLNVFEELILERYRS